MSFIFDIINQSADDIGQFCSLAMRNHPSEGIILETWDQASEKLADPVERLVLHALKALAPERRKERPFLRTYLSAMLEASLAPTIGPIETLLSEMLQARIQPVEILESYVPRTARHLGEAWVADELDFAAVTVGSARLQRVVRLLDRGGHFPQPEGAHRVPLLLLGVPRGEQHTLGASVLARLLRARGVGVHLSLELTPAILATELSREDFKALFLTASGSDKLDLLQTLVAMGRSEVPGLPILIGGPVAEEVRRMPNQLDADLVTEDIDRALEHCGIDCTLRSKEALAP